MCQCMCVRACVFLFMLVYVHVYIKHSRIDSSDIVTEVVPDNVDQIQVHNGLHMMQSLSVLLGSHLRLV